MAKIHGEGTLIKREKNIWRFRFSLGWNKQKKQYVYTPWRTVRGTKEQAIKAKAEYRNEIESGIRMDADTVTFRDYAEQFIEDRVRTKNLAPSTQRYYKYTSSLLYGFIGDTPIKDIEATTIKAVFSGLAKEGKKQHCARRVWVMLCQIMKSAVRDDLIMRNPCDKLDAIKTPPRPEPVYLDPIEVVRLVAALDAELVEAERLEGTHRTTTQRTKEPEHRYERGKSLGTLLNSHVMGVFLGLATGCRLGEVLGLTWDNVDFEQGAIKVKKQNTIDGVRDTKTPQSKRTITLDDDTFKRLKAWKAKQAEFLLSFGIAQDKETFIITNEYGERHDPRGFGKWWVKFRKANNFDALGFHKLRHTQGTLLVARGMDIRTVSNRLGHSKPSTTLDYYAHAMPARDKEAASIVGAILTAPAPVTGEVINL